MNATKGLVFSYILNDGIGRPIDWDEADKWHPEQGLLWLHLDYAEEDARYWLQEKSGIDPVSCEALLAEETRPRIVATPESLLLILRGVNCNPGADPEDMVSIRLWIERDRIISMRHRRVMAVDDIRKSVDAGKGPKSSNDFLTAVSTRLIDRMANVIGNIDDAVDDIEDQALADEGGELRPTLANLRRQTISLRRYIAPQREVLSQLQKAPTAWLDGDDRIRIRENAERTGRFIDDLDSARDRAAVTQEELNGHLAEQMTKTMYILSIVAGIFLPLGLVTGLLGVNVGGIPGANNKFGFLIVVVVLAVFALLQYLLYKKKKWI